jgi:hypothetical protein
MRYDVSFYYVDGVVRLMTGDPDADCTDQFRGREVELADIVRHHEPALVHGTGCITFRDDDYLLHLWKVRSKPEQEAAA